MTVRLTRGLTQAERDALNDEAMSRGYHMDDRRIFQPGWGWYEPWFWSPKRAAFLGITPDTPYEEAEAKMKPYGWHMYGKNHLSRFYWERWSKIRPPITVVLPNGEQWGIDHKSSNGEGWDVQGTWPNITATPSIAAGGYHGHLQNGEFTVDCERPGHPDGVYPYPSTWRRLVEPIPGEMDYLIRGTKRYSVVTEQGDPPADYREPTDQE